MTSNDSDSRQPGARRLICLPPAGAGASIFSPLLDLNSKTLTVLPVCYPGRESRFSDPLPNSISELSEALAKELAPCLDSQYVILGYSMGAIVGYELIRRWRDGGERQPDGFIALASGPPHVPRELRIHEMDEETFFRALSEMGGTPSQILQSREAMSIFEPVLRADFRNCDQYVHQPMPPLDCTIRAVASDADPLLSLDDVARWRECGSLFELDVLAGRPHILPRNELLSTVQSLLNRGFEQPSRQKSV